MSETLDSTQSSGAERIGFGPRFGALVIDAIGASIVGYVIAAIALSGAASAAQSGSAEGFVAGIIGMILGPFLGMVLYQLVEGVTGASPGKMVLGLQIANADGSKGDVALFMKRWAIKNLGYLLTLIGIFSLMWIIIVLGELVALVLFFGGFMIFGDGKITLHDKIAGTAVYKKSTLS